ncbi:hypothetical protein LCGC14_1336000 [marine sediment metagenome]|uniref:Uncharacterized protein n=1 Tax=marine sediment metagenome TaxID=412755 RepID=A0A0F9KF42_9ZZZZ
MHNIVLLYTDPRNHEKFPKWIHSLDFGSRAFCREFRLYDIACQEQHQDKLLEHLKRYNKEGIIGLGAKKLKFTRKLIQWIMKLFKLKPINMDKIEKIPKKWFKPMSFAHGCSATCYLFPIGSYPDKKDPKNKFRNEMI